MLCDPTASHAESQLSMSAAAIECTQLASAVTPKVTDRLGWQWYASSAVIHRSRGACRQLRCLSGSGGLVEAILANSGARKRGGAVAFNASDAAINQGCTSKRLQFTKFDILHK